MGDRRKNEDQADLLSGQGLVLLQERLQRTACILVVRHPAVDGSS